MTIDTKQPEISDAAVEAVARAIAKSNRSGQRWRYYAQDARAAIAAYRQVLADNLTEQQLADGVQALIDAGLDGPDGVGHSDVRAVIKAVLR